MGRILLFDDDRKPFTVTGILKDLPSQSTLQFDMLRPINSYRAVKRFRLELGMDAIDNLCKTA